jgi:3-phenylpropionate/trans-cinnamate dioxygenase ferredoxin reductase component
MGIGRVVVAGAGLAGLRTAERLRRLGHTGPITLVGAEEHLPYDRPPLSKAALSSSDARRPPLRAASYDDLDAELRLGEWATGVDGHRLLLGEDAVEFDRLVIATGVRPRVPALFASWAGMHVLRDWEHCVGLRAELVSARSLVVVGAGVLGCEVAATARGLGLDVTLVERLDQPLAPVLGHTLGAHVAGLHRRAGVRVLCSAEVTALRGGGRRTGGRHRAAGGRGGRGGRLGAQHRVARRLGHRGGRRRGVRPDGPHERAAGVGGR